MPTVITEGAMAARGFGFGASGAGGANYIEDVFSTYLYTGNGSTQTITNGIDLSTKGGLIWLKSRSAATDNEVLDTARGIRTGAVLSTNLTGAAGDDTYQPIISSLSTSGFVLGIGGGYASTNNSGSTYASWTFRKQAKFFDVVTYTGTGSEISVSHALGSIPGMVIVKRTDSTSSWIVRHRAVTADPMTIYTAGDRLLLNGTGAAASDSLIKADATTLTINNSNLIVSAGTYVAYLFAHDAGGFGAAGTDNVITCGSFTTDASSLATVNLGYEPQMVIVKAASTTSNWFMFDNMRGWSYSSARNINANTNAAETDQGANLMFPTATGFQVGGSGGAWLASSSSFIYIAIRRGPMKTPTDATKIYNAVARSGTSATATVTAGFTPDLTMIGGRAGGSNASTFFDRLRGAGYFLQSVNAQAEQTHAPIDTVTSFNINGVTLGDDSWFGNYVNGTGSTYINWMFARAPGFFDEVCYTGVGGSGQVLNHNLGVAPEMVIIKNRSSSSNWNVSNFNANVAMYLDSSIASFGAATATGISLPTSTTFKVQFSAVNDGASTYVAYLFATCPGVSKVGSYTGTGATQTVNCGFTGGARFVLIKRTDSTGDWYVWDTARGMVAGTDPSLLLNSTAAEVNANSVYTATTGFQIVSTAAGINASGGTYIFLAIA